MLPLPGFGPDMPRREDAIGGPKGSGKPEMLMGAVELPLPELFDAVLLLWQSLNLDEVDPVVVEVADGGGGMLLPLILVVLMPAALLAGSYEE